MISLTPQGWGVATLVVPGLAVAALAGHPHLIALGLGAALVLVVDAAIARFDAAGLAVDLEGPPTTDLDAPTPLRVDLSGRWPVAPVVCGVSFAADPARCRLDTPLWLAAPGETTTVVCFGRRCRLDQLRVDMTVVSRLGLTSASRSVAADLARPVVVLPPSVATPLTPDAWSADPAAGATTGTGGTALATRPGDDVDGLRPYRPGDLRRDLHWAAVARTGTMVVRDRRSVESGSSVVVDVVGRTPDELDRALGRARSVAEQVLASGGSVQLATSERRAGRVGRRVGPVTTTTLAHRLVDATIDPSAAGSASGMSESAPVAGPDHGWAAGHIIVGPEGVRWTAPT